MSTSIRISDDLYQAAQQTAKAEFRSVPQQIELWARLGRAAAAHPDLPIAYLRELVMAGAAAPEGSADAAPGETLEVRSDYVRELIRRDRMDQAREQLRGLILEGLESGPMARVDDAWWAHLADVAEGRASE